MEQFRKKLMRQQIFLAVGLLACLSVWYADFSSCIIVQKSKKGKMEIDW